MYFDRKTVLWCAGALAIFLGIILTSQRHDPVTIFFLLVTVGFGAACLRRVVNLARQYRKAYLRRAFRIISTLRRLFSVAPTVKMLHLLAWACGCLGSTLTLCGHTVLGRLCIDLFFALLFVAGMCDLAMRGTWLIRRLWTDLIGKIFSVSIGTVLIALSISSAKTWVHSIAHIDPKYLIESTAILSAVFLPVSYAIFAMFALCILAVFQILGMCAFMLLSMAAQQISPFAGSINYQKLRLIWYRLANGKRPPGKVLPSKRLALLDDLSVFAKPISTIAVISVFAVLFQGLHIVSPRVKPYVSATLVALEYRSQSSCLGLPPTLGVVYMDDGLISVVRKVGADLVFSVESCSHAERQPGSSSD